MAFSAYDALVALGASTPAIDTAWAVIAGIFAALSYLVLYYTWKDAFAKVGLAAVVVDIMAGASVLISLLVCGWADGANPVFSYMGPLSLGTLVVCVRCICSLGGRRAGL